jgi:hypothetical protein
MARLVAQPRGLLTLADHLLIQVEERDALDIAPLAAQAGGGLVVSGAQALKVIQYLRGRRYAGALLPDRQLYKGKRRKLAGQPFDPDWIMRQRSLGTAAIIPDAGYVAERDLRGLRLVLRWSAAIPGGVALLALANWWMYGEGLRLLLAGLRDTDVPVALVLEHPKDPLGVLRILQGVVALLRADVTLLMLRCDVSAVGLIAHGALAAAYGSKSSVRHLYPVPKPDGGGGGARGKESVFWPAGTALHYRDLLYDAVTASPRDPRWICRCEVCHGARLERFDAASTTPPACWAFAPNWSAAHRPQTGGDGGCAGVTRRSSRTPQWILDRLPSRAPQRSSGGSRCRCGRDRSG